MQPLETKNQATSRYKKKSRKLLTKKITQTLGTKKSGTLWGLKNRNLSGQNNHVTSCVKKIVQPLGTKKMDLIWSELFQKGLNGSKWDN